MARNLKVLNHAKNMAMCLREADFFGEELLNHSYTNFSGVAMILLKNA